MGYSESDLQLIKEFKPDLRIKKIEKPSLDSIIVEFLEKYEVFVKPVTSQTKKTGEAVMAGAITGLAGADVGADVVQISGQNKQTQVQEWTQWKQWALDNKDFPAFKEEKLAKIEEENRKIEEYLESPEFKQEVDGELQKHKEEEEKYLKRDAQILKYGGIVGALFILPLIFAIAQSSKDSNLPLEKTILVAEKK